MTFTSIRNANRGIALLLVSGVFALACAPPLLAETDAQLQPHTAEYRVKINVLGGQLKTELKSTGRGYVATHVIKPTGMSRMFGRGSISNLSEFETADGGLRPSHFESADELTRKKEHASIDFDWRSGEARGVVNGEEVVTAMDGLTQDRISIQYELMHDLLNGKPDAQYTMYDVDEVKTIDVRKIGTRRIKVPAGEFTAIGIEQQAVGSKRIITMWCVEELDYLPVIIEQRRKGKLLLRATLRKYDPGGS